jgi:tRNA nucleotidyltransferase (CCA-adding enzyme)
VRGSSPVGLGRPLRGEHSGLITAKRMRTSDLFDRYLAQVSPSDSELDRARAHRDFVRSRIGLPGVSAIINSGSYIKGTSLKPFDDIDLFVGFDIEDYDRDVEKIVTRLHFHLGSKIAGDVRLQRRSVGVTFRDGIRVDVVPGFGYKTKPGVFRLRDRETGRWVETSVERQKQFFERRQRKDGRFRDMVRLVKMWKRARRSTYGSYLMELLVARAFAQGIPQGRDVALHAFFSWLANSATKRPIVFTDFYAAGDVAVPEAPMMVLDPASPRNNVAATLSEAHVAELVSVADRCRARSGTALEATSRREAAQIWREILPDFPRP